MKIKACHVRQVLAQCLVPNKDSMADRHGVRTIYIQALQMPSTCVFPGLGIQKDSGLTGITYIIEFFKCPTVWDTLIF